MFNTKADEKNLKQFNQCSEFETCGFHPAFENYFLFG